MPVLLDADDFALQSKIRTFRRYLGLFLLLLLLLFFEEFQRLLDLRQTLRVDLRLVQTARQLLRELQKEVVLLDFDHCAAHARAHGQAAVFQEGFS